MSRGEPHARGPRLPVGIPSVLIWSDRLSRRGCCLGPGRER